MVVVTSLHPGHPGLAHEGSRDQTNKMADARGRRNMAAASRRYLFIYYLFTVIYIAHFP